MNKQLIPCLLLGSVGLCFLGAVSSERYKLDSPPEGSRPQFFKNVGKAPPSVTSSGYITVTTPAGEYITDRREVTSLSAHTYEIDGGMRVWEVTLSERSANTIRWYYTKALPSPPVSAGNPSEEGTGGKLDTLDGKKTTPQTSQKEKESHLMVPVRKTFPGTTHAHTIEFRADSLRQLDELYAYLCLMVYGWSPKHERPPEARLIYPFSFEQPSWTDWDNEQDR